ncbi:gamma-glutamyltransferase family protein [Amycolatopsis regifaucium]|uniref:Gamma-glutamyltransferase n=1 Tax=Amycolatopsis regifaucium TaxID=546365 RepID=A0A154MQ40_9PSEU|nr:gamma-glutamyltransferase [Amycolatopsis regifaucium]KZB86438.1 gamma-glutamyltransferase [Amycolatopsis regifaucium]OKA06372.1 gamma-glutamyltransferase [Amycolatopsis regifaucium]SFJ29964.1 gamma-glutamyltranspeptidase / glutathione hydrolase [Amycolatopsis regifaucium]
MFTTRPELAGTHGMVASTHWLASATGMAVLENGGNAFDAAVAAGFVLQIAEPHLCGPAGQVPGIFVTAADRTPRVLAGQGVSPAAATPEQFADLGLDLIPGSGLLPATVPGAWDGWLLLLRDHGTKSLRDVLGYAISYARHGIPLVSRVGDTIRAVRDLFTEHWPTSAALWLADGKPVEGLHRNPALADTWERLLAEAESVSGREAQIDAGRRAWSQGFVAEAIDSFSRGAFRDDSGRDHAGLLTGEDLAGWEATYEDALQVDFGDWGLVKMGAWTQGPALLQQARLLDGLRAELSYVDGIPTERTVHLAVEAAKLAFADREAWYGDSPDVPIELLISREYAETRRALITEEASAELRPGGPSPRLPAILEKLRGLESGSGATGEPTVGPLGETRGDTVHIDVVDAAGNMISVTPSGGWLQSSPTIPELGFCLDSRGQMFWLEQGLPNSLAPRKRPRITLSPSMGLRDGEPVLAFGTPGGDQQDQWQLCFWLAHTLGGLNLQESIDSPAWHTTAFPSSFYPRSWTPRELVVESRLGQSTMDALAARGHHVVDAGPWALGRLSAVSRSGGVLRAAANARGMQGYAAGR